MSDRKAKAKAMANSLLGDNRAQGASQGVNLVVTIVVAALMAAFLIPVAVDELVAVDTTSWGSGASSLWNILDLIVVLAIFLFMIGYAVSRSNM